MSETLELPILTGNIVQRNLDQLIGILRKSGNVATYTDLALRLSKLAGKNGNAWSWRYVQSVHAGTIQPSKKFIHTIEILTSEIDGVPAFIGDTEPITVYARRGTVHPNSILLNSSKSCANPVCTIQFIPIVPWQKYCPRCKRKKQNDK